MYMRRIFAVACIGLALTACSNSDKRTAEEERLYPYVTSLPSKDVLDASYKQWRHTLSAGEDFHFVIIIPTDWEILDVKADSKPEPGAFKEIGVFRQAGAWMNDENMAQNAEISVSVVNMVHDDRWASVWLEDTVVKNAPSYKILEKRTLETSDGNAADLLVSYKDKEETVMNRIAAFRRGDSIFVISGNDTPNGYRDNAEEFYTAIESFTLINDPEANPFRE